MSSDQSGHFLNRASLAPIDPPTAPEALNTKKPLPWTDPEYTAVLVLQNGMVLHGFGVGATGQATGELCFNTAMTGYQEILTDPSYAGQIITFTFPHIGNVGANPDDSERVNLPGKSGVRGCVLKAPITKPSNFRAAQHLDSWLKERGIVAISGIDTRALTTRIREGGMPNAIIAHHPSGNFDIEALKAAAKAWPGIEGMDLAKGVSAAATEGFGGDECLWTLEHGYTKQEMSDFHVVALDYGMKQNILRGLASAGCRITVLPATATADDVLSLKPDGVFLSNGPGDPAAMSEYAVPTVRQVVDSGVPVP